MNRNRLVIGIGNPNRGDDAVGLEAVRRINGSETAEVSDCSVLMELWDGRDEVIVIDAMVSGSPPGSVHKLDALSSPLPETGFTSTHAFDLGTAVSISKALGRLPASLIVYGIEAGDVSPGSAMTATVRRAMETVLSELAEES